MRYPLFLLLLLPFFGAGQSLDRSRLVCRYEYTYVRDTLQPSKKSTDLMVLKIGEKVSLFYSQNTFRSDSLMKADAANGAGAAEMMANRAKYGGRGVEYAIFSNFPQGKTTVTDKVVNDHFKYTEPFDKPKWTVLPETVTLMGYKAQKARCTFRGRQYTAWFTQEVPVDRGPWKLHGLPGLILQVADAQQYFSFRLVGLQTPKAPQEIALNGSVGYIETDSRKFASLYARFMENPMQYLNTSTPVKVTSKNPNSNLSRKRPYNPIER